MGQGSRPERVADQIRAEVTTMIARELHDPGVGFVTVTRVQVSPDLQHARVYYTSLGDAAARKNTARALERAAGFMRRQIGQRLRLRRAPEMHFEFDAEHRPPGPRRAAAEGNRRRARRRTDRTDAPDAPDDPDDR